MPRLIMEREFEKSLCLGSGIPFLFLFLLISIPNGFILLVLYRNPLRCFRKPFSVFLVFIAAVNLFNGVVVCSGETVMLFLCAFSDENVPQEGDIVTGLEYVGINSSILLATAMSIDRFVSVVCPHFYLREIKPGKLVLCNTIICVFCSIFASLQLTGISLDVYRVINVHLHITFPLAITSSAYFGIYFILKKRSRADLQRQTITATNRTLHDMRRLRIAQMEKKFAKTSFLILLFLILSLIPYFAASFLDFNCHVCQKQKWFFALKETSMLFLFLNSAVNPFLTALRINELKRSVKIILRLRQEDVEGDLQLRTFARKFGNKINGQDESNP